MKQVLVKSGTVLVEDVPAPIAGDREILVRVGHSCVSAGTELAGLRTSALPLYRRALKQPENVRRVLDMVRDEGLARTLDRVRGKLAAGSATGYSVSGEVIGMGQSVEDFKQGDRVACAGAGIANHAELVSVPVNLAVHVPDGVDSIDASTVTLGAIALQGVRRCEPTLGETIVVLGLGLLGQITAQLLRANGCRVIGIDLSRARIDTARRLGMHVGLSPEEGDWVAQTHRLTDGLGADAVIVTASSSSEKVIAEAMRCCRRKGRVIVVGDVNLQLDRSDLYQKELDVLISTSYGPGRYDPLYEEGGQDYPIAYVRWTENRNMLAYLRMLAEGAVRLEQLRTGIFHVDRASQAYDSLKAGDGMIAVLEYPPRPQSASRRVDLGAAPRAVEGRIGVALVGAGGFAQGMHLPNLLKLKSEYELRAVMSRTGANAKAVAHQYQAAYATTDLTEVLNDPDVKLLIIATRHDQHARTALLGLEARKHVLVEKPLALTEAELAAIESYFERPGAGGQVLMTGFNRRFSPAMRHARSLVEPRSGPMMIAYRMNAGFLPATHWVHGPEGGGRNIGEACHIYDLFNYLVGQEARGVTARGIDPAGSSWFANDNFTATLEYPDGTVATLTYTAMGSREHPKEQMEIFWDARTLRMNDFRSVEVVGAPHRGWTARAAQKGQLEELASLAATLRSGGPWPISLADQLSATRISFEVERQLVGR